jgi:hypothetical protein
VANSLKSLKLRFAESKETHSMEDGAKVTKQNDESNHQRKD